MSEFHVPQAPEKKKGRIQNADLPQALRPGFETAQALLNAHADRALLPNRHGFHVLTANCGEAAIEAYAREGKTVELVILDLNMPGMRGLK